MFMKGDASSAKTVMTLSKFGSQRDFLDLFFEAGAASRSCRQKCRCGARGPCVTKFGSVRTLRAGCPHGAALSLGLTPRRVGAVSRALDARTSEPRSVTG